jgi:hypothetical protein
MSEPLRILAARDTLLHSGLQLSTNHLCRAFEALGHEVLWHTRPLTPLSIARLGEKAFHERVKLWFDNWSRRPGQQICLATPLFRNNYVGATGGWLLRGIYRCSVPGIRWALRRRGWDAADVLLLSDPIQTGLRHVLPHRLLVYQVTDDYAAFPNYAADVDAELSGALQAADLLLFTNRRLLEEYVLRHRLDRSRCHYVSHGVEDAQVPDPGSPGKGIRAVFVGNINDWIDWHFVEALCERVEGLRVTFFGPIDAASRSRMDNPAFEYGGYLERSVLKQRLAEFDVGLIPFHRTQQKKFSEPMKIYDYLSAGLPVLSEIELDREFIEPFAGQVAAVEALDEAVHFLASLGHDKKAGRRDAHVEACRRFLAERTWQTRGGAVIDLMRKAL